MTPLLRPTKLIPLASMLVLVLSGCAAAPPPAWTYHEGTPGASPSAPAAQLPSPSPAPSATASPAPIETPSSSPTPASPTPPEASPSPAPSSQAEPTPRPPDPGEPGFVAGTEAAPRVIDIVTNDLLLFDPNVVSVAQGETITFSVTNEGQAEHEFKVGPMQDVFQDMESAPEVANIAAGDTVTLTYTFSGTGPYAYGCHEPGHFENGMIGFVNVVPTEPWIGSVAQPRMVSLLMDDQLEFVPTEISVTPGETILFVLSNIGHAVTHEFQLGPADRVALDQVDGQIVVEADQIEPGHVAYLTYTFGSVGPYSFACHEPGHYEAGMKGIIDLVP
jgi:uncharacterized cupredoxin-like copper-binding protein